MGVGGNASKNNWSGTGFPKNHAYDIGSALFSFSFSLNDKYFITKNLIFESNILNSFIYTEITFGGGA